MHDIEPYYNWEHLYNASEDERSPFYGKQYSEFEYTNAIYNFIIHPQWDSIGSSTLYIKVLMADYDKAYLIAELMGEWNDAIHNDIMYLKRDIMDVYSVNGIRHFILIGENVLNYHSSDDSYYEEWADELAGDDGWVALINFRPHVIADFKKEKLHRYLLIDKRWQNVNWRKTRPDLFFEMMQNTRMRMLGG